MGAVTGRGRNHAMLNGALVAVGLIAVINNVVAHWILRLHRLVPGPEADILKPIVVAARAALLAIGLFS